MISSTQLSSSSKSLEPTNSLVRKLGTEFSKLKTLDLCKKKRAGRAPQRINLETALCPSMSHFSSEQC